MTFRRGRRCSGTSSSWRDDGTVDRIHDALRDRVRDAAGRDPMASAGIVDAQSVKGADTVGAATRAVSTRARRSTAASDTSWSTRWACCLLVIITAASVQDRDGARTLLDQAADGDAVDRRWCGPTAATPASWSTGPSRSLHITVEIVRKPAGIKTFQVLPRRWVVERTFAWIVNCRRLDHDYERLPDHSEAMIKWAMIGLMARRLAPAPGRRPWQPSTAT